MLQKQEFRKKADQEDDEPDLDSDKEVIKNLASKTRKQERRRKRQEYEQKTKNFLFTDEQLMEVLSSSSSEDEAVK